MVTGDPAGRARPELGPGVYRSQGSLVAPHVAPARQAQGPVQNHGGGLSNIIKNFKMATAER